mmetsp:Transcript_29306/g.87658  ORF Transcript_29306/g.87658 Transcript_29306/m.87658 type:complete len:381 (+) Transcript_29306:328-1470(+)
MAIICAVATLRGPETVARRWCSNPRLAPPACGKRTPVVPMSLPGAALSCSTTPRRRRSSTCGPRKWPAGAGSNPGGRTRASSTRPRRTASTLSAKNSSSKRSRTNRRANGSCGTRARTRPRRRHRPARSARTEIRLPMRPVRRLRTSALSSPRRRCCADIRRGYAATLLWTNNHRYLTWSKSPDGPWTKPARLFKAQENLTNVDTNLAATIRPDGSVVGIGRTIGDPTLVVAHLVEASDWREPESYVGAWDEMLFPDTRLLPYAGVEDPFVYADARGSLHAVFHSQIQDNDERLCGAHAWSIDGKNWTFGGTAWSNRVPFVAAGGVELYRFSRRERPHFVFDADGSIVALTTGVRYSAHSPAQPDGEDACYTLLQPVRTA